MKQFLILLFVAFTPFCHAQTPTAYGPEHNGFRLAKSEGNCCLVNTHGVIIAWASETTINVDTVMKRISASTLADRALIVRVLSMYPPGEMRIAELMNMTSTYEEVARIVIADMEEMLVIKYSEKEVEDLRTKQK